MRLKFPTVIGWLVGLCWLALPAPAQIQAAGVTATLQGNLGFGYSASTSQLGQSDNGIDITGNGSLKGYFRDPSVVAFQVQPSYGRMQENTDQQSIFDTESIAATSSIFGGGYFPGNINFNKAYDSTGTFGIAGVNALLTKSNFQNFGINWNERVPGWPLLTFGFNDSTGTSNLLGSSEESHSASRTYSLHASYTLLGFALGGSVGYENAETTSFLLAGAQQASDTSSKSYAISVAHELPLRGYFATRYGRTDYTDTDATAGKYVGTTDNIDSTLGFVVKVPITITEDYTNDVFGSIQQYLLGQGQSIPLSTSTPKSSQLLLSASSQFVVLHTFEMYGYFSYLNQAFGDTSTSSTQGGGTVGYNFGRYLNGLIVNIGVVDTANQDGNERAGLVGSATYGHNLGRWGFSSSFSYDHNLNTVGVIYTTSNLNYSAGIGRRFSDYLKWSASFAGSHNGFEEQPGNGTHSESFSSNLIWRQVSANGTYSQSSGTSLMTQSGLVIQPLPTPLLGMSTIYGAQSIGGGVGITPMPKLTINGSYSTSKSLTQNSELTSVNRSDVANARVAYKFRKMNFSAAYNRLWQSISASGTPPLTISTYYFGITRWFDFF